MKKSEVTVLFEDINFFKRVSGSIFFFFPSAVLIYLLVDFAFSLGESNMFTGLMILPSIAKICVDLYVMQSYFISFSDSYPTVNFFLLFESNLCANCFLLKMCTLFICSDLDFCYDLYNWYELNFSYFLNLIWLIY